MATSIIDYQKVRDESLKNSGLDAQTYAKRLKNAANSDAIKGGKSRTLVVGDEFSLPLATPENYEGEMPLGFILMTTDGTDWCFVVCNRYDTNSIYRVAGGRFSREPRAKGADGKSIYDKELKLYQTIPLKGSFFELYRKFASEEKYLCPTLYTCAKALEAINAHILVSDEEIVDTPFGEQTIYAMDIVDSKGKPLTKTALKNLLK